VALGKAEKGEFISKHKNEGQELTYMIKGKNNLPVWEGENMNSTRGDLLYHDGKEPHSVTALEPCEFLNIPVQRKIGPPLASLARSLSSFRWGAFPSRPWQGSEGGAR